MDRFSFGTILRPRAKYESATSHRKEVHMGEKPVFQHIREVNGRPGIWGS
jgi:hypothetical protein